MTVSKQAKPIHRATRPWHGLGRATSWAWSTLFAVKSDCALGNEWNGRCGSCFMEVSCFQVLGSQYFLFFDAVLHSEEVLWAFQEALLLEEGKVTNVRPEDSICRSFCLASSSNLSFAALWVKTGFR